MEKEKFILFGKEFLKKEGFLKDRNTWRKENGELIFVYNIQGSVYDKNAFYVNIGIFFKAIEPKAKPLLTDCHIGQRVERKEDVPSYALAYSLAWFKRYESEKKIYFEYIRGELISDWITFSAKEYLSMRANIL